MRQPGQTDISLLLGQWDGEGGFASRRMADAVELNVSVRGFGKLRWPVSEADARKLCNPARPARHGYKTETRLDKGIRDTWEIGPDHLDIGPVAWPKTLDRHLDRMQTLNASMLNLWFLGSFRPWIELRYPKKRFTHAA